jgi:hypothetical protein
MSVNKIDTKVSAQLHVEETVSRKTPRDEKRGFGSVLRTGAGIALRGVEIGAGAIGGPLVGAAVRGVRAGVEGSGAAGGAGGLGGAGATLDASASQEQQLMNEMRDMQMQSQEFNLQYLALQEEVQQENRRFSTVSNVLKAKHETAKGAIQNIRS